MEDNNLYFPEYREGCIADIPGTVKKLLTGSADRFLHEKKVDYADAGNFENVVLLVIDGLGMKMLQDSLPEDSIFSYDDFSSIDSVFPSTTAAGITSLNTGLEPVEHGLIEWEVWDKDRSRVVKPLPSVNLEGEPVELDKYFEGRTIYEELSEKGIDSYVFQSDKVVDSKFTEILTSGAESYGYKNLSEMFVRLARKINSSEGKNYFYGYIGDVDSLSHAHGPFSDEVEFQINEILWMLEEFFKRVDEGSDTMLIITADHGQVDVSGERILDISTYDEVWDCISENESKKVFPTGGPRDMFLDVKDTESAIETFEKYFGEISDVYGVEELVEKDFFGIGDGSELFLERAGDILVLPRNNSRIYYLENHEGLTEMKGMHGGTSKKEMIVPFLACSIEDIKKKERD